MNGSGAANAALLARFDREMRYNPPVEPGVTYEPAGPMMRARGAQNWIVWWSLTADDTVAAVAREAEFFRSIDASVEWKVYGHDAPANLAATLSQYGFIAAEAETLMICDVAATPRDTPAPLATGIDIQPVTDHSQLAELAALTTEAFGDDHAWLFDALAPRLFAIAPSAAAYVAYADGKPVAGGRIEYPRERSFASLWGGATIPAFRRRGIFSALVRCRMDQARAAGYRFVTVDARATSRPILERLGFVALSEIVGWILSCAQPRFDCTATPARTAESEGL